MFQCGQRSLSSDFDWLSLEAFSHFDKAKNETWKRLEIIHGALRCAEADLWESSYSLTNTFNALKTSFQLMMVQITFLNEFVSTYA